MTGFEEIHPGVAIAPGIYRGESLEIAGELTGASETMWEESDTPGLLRYERGPNLLDNTAYTLAYEIGAGLVPRNLLTLEFFKYIAGSEGPWHCDDEQYLPLYVLYLDDIEVPTFQYDIGEPQHDEFGFLLDPGEEDVMSVQVSAGDLLKITDPRRRHRGINPTGGVRNIASMFHYQA